MALRKFVFLNSSEGFVEEQGSSDELSLGKVTATGVGGIAFDASSQRIVNVPSPSAASDAVPRSYVDAVLTGLDLKASCRVATTANLSVTASGSGVGKTLTATANGAISIDGVSLSLGNRVLVKDQGTGADNGIYTVTTVGDGSNPYVLTRATDADENAEVTAGLFTFIEEGTVNADTGWILVTNNAVTVDSTSLTFSQFSAAVTLTYDQGLLKSGTSIQVELDTSANAQGAGAGGGSSGLEFDANTAAGKLRAAVAPTGGIQRSASGLGILADPTPNNITTGAAGASVTSAPKLISRYTTSAAVSAYAGVYISGSDTIDTGDCSNDTKSRIIGVAVAAIGNGSTGYVQRWGVLAGALSGATAGTPYYLQTTGQPVVYGSIAASNRVIRLGWALNATDLLVDIQDIGKKAA